MRLLLEHKQQPGVVYRNRLIFGEVEGIFNEMELHESRDETGRNVIKFRGKFQEADAVNKNKRTYPYDVLDVNVQRLEETIQAGGLVGELALRLHAEIGPPAASLKSESAVSAVLSVAICRPSKVGGPVQPYGYAAAVRWDTTGFRTPNRPSIA